jgi:tripartite-type tricarboxylate transporter receptor subunit TctC
VAGHIQMLFSDPLPAPSQIRAGNVRALGVSSPARWDIMPEIPTIAESGVASFDSMGWTLAAFPAGTPKEIVDRMAAEFKAISKQPEAKEALAKLGMVLVESDPPEAVSKFIAAEGERWGKIVRQAGLAGTL